MILLLGLLGVKVARFIVHDSICYLFMLQRALKYFLKWVVISGTKLLRVLIQLIDKLLDAVWIELAHKLHVCLLIQEFLLLLLNELVRFNFVLTSIERCNEGLRFECSFIHKSIVFSFLLILRASISIVVAAVFGLERS